MHVRKPFLTVFFGLRKVRFQCYCSEFKFSKIVLVLKLLQTTFYVIVKTLFEIPCVGASIWKIEMLVRRPPFHSFWRITRSTFPMLLCSVQFQSHCSGAQTTSNNLLYHRRNFVLDSFRRSLDMEY